VLRCLKTDAESASVTSCFFKKSDNGQSPKKKSVPLKAGDAHYLFHLHITISDAGLGLGLHGPFQRFICESVKTSHI
jgi:hypothetical protein